MVESVKPTSDGTQAEVTYTAMDNSRNVAKKKILVNYQASGEPAPAEDGQTPEGTDANPENGEAGAEAPAPEGEGEAPADVPADAPVDPAAAEQPGHRGQRVQKQRKRHSHSFRQEAPSSG